MQSKISLVNRELFKQTSRNIGWVSIVYFLTLIFSIPLDLLMTATNEYREFWKVDTLFQYNNEIQLFSIIVIPVLLGVFLFRYLHVKESSDLFHSLPIKRERIFHQYTLTGLIFLILPVLATTVILMIQHTVWNLEPYFSVGDIFYWAGVTIVLNVIVYMGSVFIGMITGISLFHGVMTYIFLLLPLGSILLFAYNLQFFLYGYAEDYYINNNIGYFSPLVITDNLRGTTINPIVLWIYVGISIILYILGLYLYKKRKLETVLQPLVFPILRPILKFGMTLFSAFFAAVYFGETQGDSSLWLIFGYVIGSFIGYLIAEMLLQKTWRVFGNLRNYLFYAGALILFVLIVQFDLTGFEKRVPELDEIKSVYLSDSPYLYLQRDDRFEPLHLEEEESIELVRGLHDQIIHDKQESSNPINEIAFIVYELENGKRIVREYTIDINNYRQYYEPLYESAEFKEMTNSVFHVNEDEIRSMTIHPSGPKSNYAVISNQADIQDAISILKEDIHEASYEDIIKERGVRSHVSITTDDDYPIDFTVFSYYENFMNWLEEKALLEKAMVTEKDISHALIVEAEDVDLDYKGEITDEGLYEKLKQAPKVLEIKEKNQIKTLMNLSSEYYFNQPKVDYIVCYFFELEQYPVFYKLDSESAPDSVKQYFK